MRQTLQILIANFNPCAHLRYGFVVAGVEESGDLVEVTYEGTDLAGRRVWLMQSTGGHGAVCYRSDKNKLVYDGQGARRIPLKIRITEVPHGS